MVVAGQLIHLGMANRLNVIQTVAIHVALNMDGVAIKSDIANAKIAWTTANNGSGCNFCNYQ